MPISLELQAMPFKKGKAQIRSCLKVIVYLGMSIPKTEVNGWENETEKEEKLIHRYVIKTQLSLWASCPNPAGPSEEPCRLCLGVDHPTNRKRCRSTHSDPCESSAMLWDNNLVVLLCLPMNLKGSAASTGHPAK